MARKTLRTSVTSLSDSPSIRKDSYAFVHQEDLTRQSLVNKSYVDSAIAALSQDVETTYATKTALTNGLAEKPNFQQVTNSLVDTVGWTGKNVLNTTIPSQTLNGVVFTLNDDKTLTAITPSDFSTRAGIYQDVTLEPGDYIGSGGPGNGFEINFQIRNNDTIISNNISNNSEVALTILSGYKIRVWVNVELSAGSNTTATFKPMLRRADDPDPTYVPYHSTVANELASKQTNVYSSNETAIGTWSDGTTIYRKSVSGAITTYSEDGTSRAFYASDLASNVSSIVNLGGTYIRNSGHKNSINVPFVSTTGLVITGIPSIYINSSGKLKLVFFGDSSTTRIDFDIYVDYTMAN